jgi:hypothetical protein
MRVERALLFGVLGAVAMTLISAVARALGIPMSMELLLGTLVRSTPDGEAFGIGVLIHLLMGGFFGLVYAVLFERVWDHGGATTGMLLAVLHATLIGSLVGLLPRFHPLVPRVLPDPGAFFSELGVGGALTFFLGHLAFGAIVGAGYGHVSAERQWAPTGRL